MKFYLQPKSLVCAGAACLFCAATVSQGAAQAITPGNAYNQGPGPINVPYQMVDPATKQFWDQTAAFYTGAAMAGAVQAIAVGGDNQIYIGSANGGVWGSANGGQSWMPLTDRQASLSIGALAVDPMNSSNVVAGVGITSSNWIGGPLTGLMFSTNGGSTWNTIGATDFGLPADTLPNFDAIEWSGNYVFAASSSQRGGSPIGGSGGLFLFDTTTQKGQQLILPSPLLNPNVMGLAVTHGSSPIIYAAVGSSGTGAGGNGLYVSTDNGSTFTQILSSSRFASIGSADNIKVAVTSNGTVVVATASSSNIIDAYILSPNSSDPLNDWKQIIFPKSMELLKNTEDPQWLILAADPKDPQTIYLGNTSAGCPPNPNPCPPNPAGALYRMSVDPSKPGYVSSAVDIAQYDPNANPPTNLHNDYRAIAFKSGGELLMGSDGGLYQNNNPKSNVWSPLMKGYVGGEAYSVAWNSLTKTVAGGFQDLTLAYQKTANGIEDWSPLYPSGDGSSVAFNSLSLKAQNEVILYGTQVNLGFDTTTQFLSFYRGVLRMDNTFKSLTQVTLTGPGGTSFLSPNWTPPFVLNQTDPSQIAIGAMGIYLFHDDFSKSEFATKNITGNNDMGNNVVVAGGNVLVHGGVTSIAYGIHNNNNTKNYALAALAGNSQNYAKLYATPNALTQDMQLLNTTGIKEYSAWEGAIAFDPNSYPDSRIFVAGKDGNSKAAVFLVCLPNNPNCPTPTNLGLPPSFLHVNSVTAIDNNNVRALFAGGISKADDHNKNGFGSLYVLQDTMAKDWSGGQWINFAPALPNVHITQLAYSYEDDLLAIATFGRGLWTIPDVTSYFKSAKSINLGNANYSTTRNEDFTDGVDVDGNGFSRGLNKVGTGLVTLGSHNTYTGPTNVQAGALMLNRGSNTGVGLTTIFREAALGGTGAIDGSLVNYGLLHPGSSLGGGGVGVLTVAGDLTLAPGSIYSVEIAASGASDKTFVKGSTTIDGGSVVVRSNMNPAQFPTTRISILSSSQGVSGRFDNLIGLPNYSFLSPTLLYGGYDVSLGYKLTPFNVVGRTINQRNVGTALTIAAFGPLSSAGGNVLNTLYYGSYQSAPGVMETIGGAGLAGVQTTAMEIGQMASSTVSDQIAFWRSGATGDTLGVTLHEAANDNARSFMAYAPIDPGVTTKAPAPTRGRVDSLSAQSSAPRTFRAWGSMFGGAANFSVDMSRGAPSANTNFYGGLLGVDYQLTPNALLGVALGGSNSGFNVGSLATSGNLTGFHAGLYGAYAMGSSYLALNETFSAYSNQTNRSAGGYIFLPYEKLSASFGSTEFRTRLEGGHSLLISGLKATPFLAAEFAAYQSNAFTEQSSLLYQSSLMLRNNGQSINSVPVFVGLRLSNSYTFGNGWRLMPVGSVAYVHEFSPNRQLTNMLMSIPGPDFNVAGPRSTYNLVQAKIGAQLHLNNEFALFTDFQGEFSSASRSYGGKGGLRYYW